MKKLFFVALVAALLGSCGPKSVELKVENPDDKARMREVVEVAVESLGLDAAKGFTVYDAEGTEVPSQVTHDGLLLLEVEFLDAEPLRFTVKNVAPKEPYQTYACGRVYPERVDDLAWESDLIAYRLYGPALQQSGERAFGYDVWVKNNTPLPVVEERYNKELNPKIKAKIAKLRQTNPVEADKLYASVSYHNDHGNGFDAYKVGPTLGGGATALLDGGKIVYPYCYKECEIVDNGPLRFTAELVYHPTTLSDGRTVTEHRTISIDKGDFMNKTTVKYVGDKGELKLMSGIVLHQKSPRTIYNPTSVLYAEPVEAPDGGELYQALMLVEEADGMENRLWKRGDERPAGAYGHAAVYNTVEVGQEYTYYWGALWNKGTEQEVKCFDCFEKLMAQRSHQEAVAAKVTIME